MLSLFSSLALASHGKYVTELTSKTFKKLVEGRNDSTVWIVDFQGDYCPACRQAAPLFAEAAEQSLGMVKFGSLDTQKNSDIAGKFNIRYIPTFIIFYPGGHKVYMGERSTRGFCNAAAKYIPSQSEEADETWFDGKSKSVILFTNKKNVPPMWAAISNYFKGNDEGIRVGHALDGNKKDEFNVTAFPTVLAIDGEKSRQFDGKPNFQRLKKFIEQFFAGTLPEPTPKPTPKPKGVKIESIDTEEKFERVCRNHKNCVIIAGKETDEFKKVALKFHNDPFVFAAAPEEGELNYINKGIWVFHRTQPKAVIVPSEDQLATALDRVLDGSQKWKSVADLREGAEL
jgi:thiol-disulfide isomerase/thioredoxin